MTVSIIDPIGGKIGLDDYHFGYMVELSKKDNKVIYFSNSKTKNRNIKGINQVDVFGEIWSTPSRLKKFYFLLRGYLLAFIFSKNKKSNIIHLHFFSVNLIDLLILIIARILTKASLIVTVHDVESFRSNNLRFVEKMCYKLVNGIIVHNEFSKLELLKRIKISRDIFVIPQGNYINDVPKFQPKKIKSEKIELLFFGQLKKIKGIDVLIDAACILADKSFDFHLTIAGKPWDLKSEDLIDKIKSNNLDKFVSLKLTFISNEEKNELYKKSDIVILPYKKIYNSGVLMLTASMNKPLIVSDLEPFTDILENEINGIVFKNNDAKDLANKILNINLPKMDIFADRLFDKVELEYSWERITIKLIDSYKKLINLSSNSFPYKTINRSK